MTAKPAWEQIVELSDSLPQHEIDKLPKGGALNHDKYLNEQLRADAFVAYLIGKRDDELLDIPDGYHFEINRRDGTHYPVYYNADFYRVNLEIDNGVITKASIG